MGYSDLEEIKIIEMEWRNSTECIGFILAENEKTKKQCAYMGVGPGGCWGNSIEQDAKHILDWGYRMTYQEAIAFLKNVKWEKYCDESDGLLSNIIST